MSTSHITYHLQIQQQFTPATISIETELIMYFHKGNVTSELKKNDKEEREVTAKYLSRENHERQKCIVTNLDIFHSESIIRKNEGATFPSLPGCNKRKL